MTALLEGLALNPAAPTDLLLRLLEPEYEGVWTTLASRRASFPEQVTAAIVHHPHPRVRGALARNPFVDPEVRGLVVDDPEWIVRVRLAHSPDRTRPVRPLPDPVIDRMLTTYDDDCLQELFFSRQIPFRFLLSCVRHPVASVRQLAVNVWTHLSDGERAALLRDPHPRVRDSARRVLETDDAEAMERRLGPLPAPRNHGTTGILVNHRLSRTVVDWLLHDPDRDNSWILAHNHSTPPDVVAGLVDHPDPAVRLELARRDDLARALVDVLARDPDPRVRTAVSVRPELTEDERAAIDCTVDTDEDFGPLEHHTRPAPDPAASASYARSRHPLLRRRAARTRPCPPHSWRSSPGTRTWAYGCCSPTTIRRRRRNCCCAATWNTAVRPATCSPSTRASLSPGWARVSRTRPCPPSDGWPCSTPSSRRPSPTASPATRTRRSARERPAIPACRAGGCSPSSQTGNWAGPPPPIRRCPWR